ncbi:beta-galactosidase [Streptomyces sp. NPDC052101]|uniref:beta-galactosidase n=1 Tax=Streptomyces sp. NPDC052101 TaxID=3155763 RepID=UPI003422722E
MTARSITARLGGLAFGGDCHPKQWDEPVRKEDDERKRRVRVNLAAVAAFSWTLLEPQEERYDFAWLDAHIDELPGLPAVVETVTRHAPDGRHQHFLIDHGTAAVPAEARPWPAHRCSHARSPARWLRRPARALTSKGPP